MNINVNRNPVYTEETHANVNIYCNIKCVKESEYIIAIKLIALVGNVTNTYKTVLRTKSV